MTKKDHADFNFVSVTALPVIYLIADLLATGSFTISLVLTLFLTLLTVLVSAVVWGYQTYKGRY